MPEKENYKKKKMKESLIICKYNSTIYQMPTGFVLLIRAMIQQLLYHSNDVNMTMVCTHVYAT